MKQKFLKLMEGRLR